MESISKRDAERALMLCIGASGAWAALRWPAWDVVVPAVVAVGAFVAARGLSDRMAARRWLSRGGVACLTASVSISVLTSTDVRVAPTMVAFAIVASLALAVDGFRLAGAVLAVAAVTDAHFLVTHEAAGLRDLVLRRNIAFNNVGLVIFIFSFLLIFVGLDRALRDKRDALEQRLSERTRLVGVLGTELREALAAMGAHLATPASPERTNALVAAHRSLRDLLQEARESLGKSVLASDASWQDALPRFRLRVGVFVVVSGIVTDVLLALRAQSTGAGVMVVAIAAAAFNVGCLTVLLARPAWRRWVFVVHGVVLELMVLSTFTRWGLSQVPPSVVFLAGFTYHAVLIGDRRAAVIIPAVQLGVLFSIYVNLASAGSWERALLSTLALSIVTLQSVYLLVEERIETLLQTLRDETQQLHALDQLKGRLCGALFHDVANPLHTLGMHFALGDADEDTQRCVVRLHERLERLVDTAVAIIVNDAPLTDERLEPTRIDRILLEVEECFGWRAREKSQTLVLVVPEGPVVARVVPELLRDCVVANLLSNAIKFSPPGSDIELRASRDRGRLVIQVRDRGPGFPSEVVTQLEEHAQIHSTRGTEGETGLGLGLTLCQEYAERMRGKLELEVTDRGGVARVSFPATQE